MRRGRPSVETFAVANHFKWSVLWVVPDKDSYRIVRKEFDNDFTEALRVYNLARLGKKRLATLRSNNVAFPPPKKYLPYTRQKVHVEHYTKQGKQRKRKVLRPYEVIPMETMNRKGWYWCPYCREMRKFQHQVGFPIGEKSFVDAPGMYCPLCGVSHRNFAVRRWNPHAWRLFFKDTQPRSTRSTQTSTRQRMKKQRTSRTRSTQ